MRDDEPCNVDRQRNPGAVGGGATGAAASDDRRLMIDGKLSNLLNLLEQLQ